MRAFNITVNGKQYAVEVEEVGAGSAPVMASVPVAAPAPVAAPSAPAAPVAPAAPAAPAAPVSAPSGAETIKCPMPGTILAVNCSAGSSVKKGEVIFILEAMKMENEIMAPRDCVIEAVSVSKGATVNTGDILAVLK